MKYTYDESILSDLIKDVYGARPGPGFTADWDALTKDGKQAYWERLLTALSQKAADDKELETIQLLEWANRIELVMCHTNASRQDVIRWVWEAHWATEDTIPHLQDVEHFVWTLGILYTDTGATLVETIMQDQSKGQNS